MSNLTDERQQVAFDECRATIILRTDGQPPRRIETGECTGCTIRREGKRLALEQTFADGTCVTTLMSGEKVLRYSERLALVAKGLE